MNLEGDYQPILYPMEDAFVEMIWVENAPWIRAQDLQRKLGRPFSPSDCYQMLQPKLVCIYAGHVWITYTTARFILEFFRMKEWKGYAEEKRG